MDLAAVQILLLSQGDISLEVHRLGFLDLVHLVHYDDDSLCLFFWMLSTTLIPSVEVSVLSLC